MPTEDPSDPLDQNVDRLWDHLQTTASDREREMWEGALQAWQVADLPWWRRLPGLRPRPARLPPREAERPSQEAAVGQSGLQPGYPIEGFFAARDEVVDESLVEHGPGPEFSVVEAKMLSPVEVASLGEIIGAGLYERLVDQISASEREGPGGSTGLYRVPTEMRDRLAQGGMETSAAAWAATEEMQDWDPDDVRSTLAEMQTLAVDAVAEEKHLWVWWSV